MSRGFFIRSVLAHTENDIIRVCINCHNINQGLTQSGLADLVFCNTSHISNIENNHTKVSLNSLLAIANALNTSIDHLLSEQFDNASTALDTDIVRRLRKLAPEKKRLAIRIMEVL